jgi:hypothetical protein
MNTVTLLYSLMKLKDAYLSEIEKLLIMSLIIFPMLTLFGEVRKFEYTSQEQKFTRREKGISNYETSRPTSTGRTRRVQK